ncbi:MAG: hypothetical protein ACI81S_001007 [Sphingobacteriales bacterium]|jgi:hypothetical protein
MMKFRFGCLIAFLMLAGCNKIDVKTPFEIKGDNYSASYEEGIAFYTQLAKLSPKASLLEYGVSDSGEPIYLFVLSKKIIEDKNSLQFNKKTVVLINNDIHPGEPAGVDATMMLARDILKVDSLTRLLEHVVVGIIPYYNIGGALNRNSTSRANQVGPEEYGFRGNAKNLDLNRDFIKSDSRNAKVFAQIYQDLAPHVFVDNHTTNGADYHYPLTLISTQKDKMNPLLADFMTQQMVPHIERRMKEKGYEVVPYVNSIGQTPEMGIIGFLETPRYSSGYASLFNAISFISEAHMLKPFETRVWATYNFNKELLEFCSSRSEEINSNKISADKATQTQPNFELTWELDTNEKVLIDFKGYDAEFRQSEVTGLQRQYYNRDKPFTKKVKYFNKYRPTTVKSKPEAYIVPQAYSEIVDLLKLNGVKIQKITKSQNIEVESYYIDNYQTLGGPFEGHYLHYNTSVRWESQSYELKKGDFLVYCNQVRNNFIVHVLEPEGTDSYFNWNFFDAILGQKEYFSSYVFEDTAAELLRANPKLKIDFESKKSQDVEFASNARAQLNFIYKNSEYYEKSHLRYPIRRLLDGSQLSK